MEHRGRPQRIVVTDAGLQTGHQVRVYFNGEPQMVSGTSFQLDEVWRGVHNLQAEVLDETGQMMIRSTAESLLRATEHRPLKRGGPARWPASHERKPHTRQPELGRHPA